MSRKRKRKINEVDPDYTNNNPAKMTAPELQLHLMQYGVSFSRSASKKELVALYKEKVGSKQRSAKRQRIGDTFVGLVPAGVKGKNKRKRSNDEEKEEPPSKRQVRKLTKLPMIRPKTKGRALPSSVSAPASGPSSNKKRRLARLPTLALTGKSSTPRPQSGPLVRKGSGSPFVSPNRAGLTGRRLSAARKPSNILYSPGSSPEYPGSQSSSLSQDPIPPRSFPNAHLAIPPSPAQQLLNPHNFPPAANHSGHARTSSHRALAIAPGSGGSSVVGNSLVSRGQKFKLGDKVIYKGDEWSVNSIDYQSLTMDIKKGSRIVNTLPSLVTLCEEEEVQNEDDSLEVPSTPAVRRQGSNGNRAFSGLVPKNNPKPPNKAAQMSIFAIVAVAVLSAVFYYIATTVLPNNVVFCDFFEKTINGELVEDCVSCPINGNCEDGVVTCWAGYELRGRACLKTKEYKRELKNVIDSAADVLAEARGAAECKLGLGAPESKVTELAVLSTEQIKERVMARMDLNDTDFEGHDRFTSLYRTAMQEFKDHFSISGRKYYSNVAKKTWACTIWQIYWSHPALWTTMVLGGVLSLYLYNFWLGVQREWHYTQPMGKKVAERVFAMLQAAALNLEPAIPVDQVQQSILKGQDGGPAVEPDAWEYGYKLIREDSRIVVTAKMFDGKQCACMKLSEAQPERQTPALQRAMQTNFI